LPSTETNKPTVWLVSAIRRAALASAAAACNMQANLTVSARNRKTPAQAGVFYFHSLF